MPTRRDLDLSNPAPVKPPQGAELWPSIPLDDVEAKPAPPSSQGIDDLLSQGGDFFAEDARAEDFLEWLKANRQAQGSGPAENP